MKRQEQFEERMAGSSGYSVLIFVLSTVFTDFSQQYVDQLLSVSGIVFIIVGCIGAMFFVGTPYHVLQNDLLRLLSNKLEKTTDQWFYPLLFTVLLVGQIVLVYFVTKLMFIWYFTR